MTAGEFSTRLFLLAQALKRAEPLTTEVTQLYWQALWDVPEDWLDRAFKLAMVKLKFFPVPAELRELAGMVDASPHDLAEIAWRQCRIAIDLHGPYRTVQFEDAVINATVEALGGWPALEDRDDLDTWGMKNFKDTYAAFVRTRTGSMDPLLGIGPDPERKITFIKAAGYRPLLVSGKGLPQLPENIEAANEVKRMISGIGTDRRVPGKEKENEDVPMS